MYLLIFRSFVHSGQVIFLNSLPNDKILEWSKLKAFEDGKRNETEKLKFILGREENIVGKGENAGYQHFLLFPQMFFKASFLRVKNRTWVQSRKYALFRSHTFSQRTNFRLFQTERVCKRQSSMWCNKWQKVLQKGKNTGKMGNCLLRAFFPFCTVFSANT